jgi:hypothetical protein
MQTFDDIEYLLRTTGQPFAGLDMQNLHCWRIRRGLC